MNLVGVTIQLLFPCSPPWYENLYGLAPANYSMAGSPAGLARIDALLGFDMFSSKFIASPMVFGAFPSLHAGSATIEALFMSHVFPRLRPLFIAYTLWLWWATMYLSHHYAVDLVGGSLRKFVSSKIRYNADFFKSLVSSSTSRKPTFSHGYNRIRCSDGTMTIAKSAMFHRSMDIYLRILTDRILPIATNGPSALHLRSPQARSVLSMRDRPTGRVKSRRLIPIPKPSDNVPHVALQLQETS